MYKHCGRLLFPEGSIPTLKLRSVRTGRVFKLLPRNFHNGLI